MVEAYENRHYPIGAADPVEAIKFRMDHIVVEFQTLVLPAIAYRVGQDLPAVMAVEQVIPALHRESQEIGPSIQVHWHAA